MFVYIFYSSLDVFHECILISIDMLLLVFTFQANLFDRYVVCHLYDSIICYFKLG